MGRLEGGMNIRIQGSRDAGGQGYKVTRIQGYRVTGVQGHKDTRMQTRVRETLNPRFNKAGRCQDLIYIDGCCTFSDFSVECDSFDGNIKCTSHIGAIKNGFCLTNGI